MFAIYFPGRTGYTTEHLGAAGLGGLLDDTAPSFADLLPGPDGGNGVACYWPEPDSPPLVGSMLEWQKHLGQVYFGRPKDRQLTPEDFARNRRQPGADIVLADGNAWHVPVARQLPEILGLDQAGNWTGRIDPRYQAFWEASWSTLDWFVPDESGTCRVDYQAGAEFIVAALAINYRISREIASWLGLIRSDLFWPVARVVTEFDRLVAQKKTELADLTSAGGPA